MPTTSSASKPAPHGLGAAEFRTAVYGLLNTHLVGPIIGAPEELNQLQQTVCRSLMDAANLAERLVQGMAGEMLLRLFMQSKQDAEVLFESARSLELRLWQARKAAGLSPRIAVGQAPGSSATVALACILYQVTGAVIGIAEQAAFNDFDGRVSEEGENAEYASAAEALTWDETAKLLRDRFTKSFAFPDPSPLFAEMRVELMELAALADGNLESAFPAAEVDPSTAVSSPKVGARDLAEICNITPKLKALDALLARWRKDNSELCTKEWWTVEERGPQQPRYIYLLSSVQHIAEALRARSEHKSK